MVPFKFAIVSSREILSLTISFKLETKDLKDQDSILSLLSLSVTLTCFTSAPCPSAACTVPCSVGTVLIYFALLWETPWPKAVWEGNTVFGILVLITAHHWAKSGQELRQKQGQEPWRMLLTFLLMACSACSYVSQDRLSFSTMGWALPPQSLK